MLIVRDLVTMGLAITASQLPYPTDYVAVHTSLETLNMDDYATECASPSHPLTVYASPTALLTVAYATLNVTPSSSMTWL